MEESLKDSRFAHIANDARFRRLPKKHVKIKADKRFQSMFTDKKFQIKYSVDKRGRPVNLESSEDLKKYYDLSESGSEDDSEVSEEEKEVLSDSDSGTENVETADKDKGNADEEEENSETVEVDKVLQSVKKEQKFLTPDVKEKLKDLNVDYARGEGRILSDSSSDEESSEEEPDIDFDHNWGEIDRDAVEADEITNRLAICNMDWDRIKATDLMVLFHSFLPPGGLIHSITVHPSDYGLQKMKEDDERGPSELVETIPGEDTSDEEEVNIIQREKLRTYQLNRLKYYYAVMVCDTPDTANSIYSECDGLEYESSKNKLDLRFIPNDTTFDQEPKETCTSLPDFQTYRPRLFMNTALSQIKVDLTWDETDPDRLDMVKSVQEGNLDEEQLKRYLASTSEEESEVEEEKEKENEEDNKHNGSGAETEKDVISKYKSLLLDIDSEEKNKKKGKVNLEVTWNLKLENKTNEKVKEAVNDKSEKTPFEQFLEKRKEKRKKKKEDKKDMVKDKEGASEESAFSDDEVPSDIDLNDPYFKEEMQSSKTGTKKKKDKKKKYEEEEEDEETKARKAQLELLMLDGDDGDKHFSLRKIEEREKNEKKKKFKKGKKRKVEENAVVDDFQIDVKDERFSALYSSHHFNIDPADSQFRRTKGTIALIEEKLKRRTEEPPDKVQKNEEPKKKRDAELSNMVKNIKSKTAEAYKRKNSLSKREMADDPKSNECDDFFEFLKLQKDERQTPSTNPPDSRPSEELTKKGEVRKRKIKSKESNEEKKRQKLEALQEKHKVQSTCNCKLKTCNSKISKEQRTELNKQFWTLSWSERQFFVATQISQTDVKRRRGDSDDVRSRTIKYFLRDEKGRSHAVCKTFFLTTLGFNPKNDRIITNALRKPENQKCDNRGKQPKPKLHRDVINDHVESFFPVVSHYAPNKRYLPSDITIKEMHADFKEVHPDLKCSYELYRSVVTKELNVSFATFGHQEFESWE